MRPGHSLPLLFVLLLLGCPPAGRGGGGGPGGSVIGEEESDADNDFPTDAEPVSVEWTDRLVIRGDMSDCGYDADESWPWTGDEDNYRVEVPEDGYIDVLLTWEHGSDLDLLVWFEPPGGVGTVSPDEQLTFADDDGVIEYLFDDPYDRGDDFVLTVLCASGPGGDYELTVNWES